LRKVPQQELVATLFAEIDKYVASKRVEVDEVQADVGARWLEQIEAENADELTPERIAALERAQLDESVSPVAGRRFTRTG
jgi:(E)-4-hydroxy-3-methylbut-2-enyl-diphosphate synthase